MVLVVIAEAAHADGSGAYPSLDTIAKRAGCPRSSVPRAIARLEALGELRVDRATGGTASNRYTVLGVPGQQLALLAPEGGLKTADGWSQGATTVVAKSPLGGRKVRPEPGTPPLNPTEPGAARPARVPPFEKVPTVADEQRAQLEEVKAVWLAGRQKIGTERFTDPAALRNLKIATKRSLGHDEWADVIAGVRAHSTDPDASPWYIDRWAGEARAARQERESSERRRLDRERVNAEHDAKIASEQDDPQMAARVRGLIADTKRRLGMATS
jgi:hypothetical protein